MDQIIRTVESNIEAEKNRLAKLIRNKQITKDQAQETLNIFRRDIVNTLPTEDRKVYMRYKARNLAAKRARLSRENTARPQESRAARSEDEIAIDFITKVTGRNENYTANDVKAYAERLSDADFRTFFSYIMKSMPGKQCPSTSTSTSTYNSYNHVIASVPPGYEYISTPGDGDCMFYAIYYTWYPDQIPANKMIQQDASKIQKLRNIVQNQVSLNDLVSTITVLEEDFKEAGVKGQYDRIMQSQSSLADKYNQILLLYKNTIKQNNVFWGTQREIVILNRYASVNNLPQIWVWNGAKHAITTFNPNGVPIHFDGKLTNAHYSALKEIPGKEAERRQFYEIETANQIARNAVEVQSEDLTRRAMLSEKRAKISNALLIGMRNKIDSGLLEHIESTILRRILDEQYQGPASSQLIVDTLKNELTNLIADKDRDEVIKIVRDTILQLQGGKRKRRTRKHKKRYI